MVKISFDIINSCECDHFTGKPVVEVRHYEETLPEFSCEEFDARDYIEQILVQQGVTDTLATEKEYHSITAPNGDIFVYYKNWLEYAYVNWIIVRC